MQYFELQFCHHTLHFIISQLVKKAFHVSHRYVLLVSVWTRGSIIPHALLQVNHIPVYVMYKDFSIALVLIQLTILGC